MSRVVNIEKYESAFKIAFAGTLRNEKKFELLQQVFIESNGKMYQCVIIGIEIDPIPNSDYIYKVEIPEEFIEKTDEPQENRVSLTCDNIFSTIAEAKESALKLIDIKYELNKKRTEQFFKRYE